MTENNQEKFKTSIGGQALIEGIMMRGPQKDAVVVRTNGELDISVTQRKVRPKGSVLTWPLIRGVVNFFDAQVVGVKALMHSADLAPEEEESQEQSRFDKWLEEKLGNEKFQSFVIGCAVTLGICMSIGLFFLIPMVIGGFLTRWIDSNLVLNLVEGLIRILIFVGYMVLVSRIKEMRRVFSYHGAEHKTIRCYEAGLPLTVENVRRQTRLHPRCGTSFLILVVIISVFLYSVLPWSSTGLRVLLKLLLLPVVMGISYEVLKWCGRSDSLFSHLVRQPGLWVQRLTVFEPDDSMIEVAIEAVKPVLPERPEEGRW